MQRLLFVPPWLTASRQMSTHTRARGNTHTYTHCILASLYEKLSQLS